MNPQRAALQLLKDLQTAGLSQLPNAEPIEFATTAAPDKRPQAEAQSQQRQSEPKSAEPASAPTSRDDRLKELASTVASCQRCPELANSRTQTVFGVGDPNARVMFIGEAPGADEDRTGEPFVGESGQLLNKIIEACGWKREQLYICNILRCRPPGNRNPSFEEAANCREYLDSQIKIVAPEYIVCWGGVAAKNLLNTDESVGRLRQRFSNYKGAKVVVTYHPSYLLRDPSEKKKTWADMKMLMADMGHTTTS